MKYPALREYIKRRGGLRVAAHGPLRERVIDWIVADWPVGAREDELPTILMERMSRRLKEKYSSVILTFVLYIVVSQLVKLAIDWFLDNRMLMAQYHAEASGIV